MAGDVLHSWAADAQAEIDQLRAENADFKRALSGNDVANMVYARECAELRAEVERLQAMTSVTCGVGDGSGRLFVHGDYDSIKRVQSLIFDVEALRKDAERYVPLHEAIQRAAGELPEGWEIRLCIERHGGAVELIGPEGTEDFDTNNERLDYTVIDALEAAMAAKED